MELLNVYKNIRQASLDMCKPLNTEDYIPQASFFASPPKWNLGHTSWFFEEMILKHYKSGYKEFHPRYGFLFNSYYNTLGKRVQRENRGDLSRPTVTEVYEYRSYVDNHMVDMIHQGDLTAEIKYLITLGLNHEQQHQELFFTDLKYTFSVNPLFPAYSSKAYCEDTNKNDPEFIFIQGGTYDVGFTGDGFYYDNEGDRHEILLRPYEIKNTLVTNGEYLDFIKDGGYSSFEFWHDEALTWLREFDIKQPLYWQKLDGIWKQYTLAGLKQINPHHILTHISYYEAAAFAQWKGLRLPTEFEWEAASGKLNWGQRWEWTESAYLPYPGYQKAGGAVGEYNGKFMVNQKVLRGASVVTAKGHSRKSYRNFFHPQMNWQFNGIRLAK